MSCYLHYWFKLVFIVIFVNNHQAKVFFFFTQIIVLLYCLWIYYAPCGSTLVFRELYYYDLLHLGVSKRERFLSPNFQRTNVLLKNIMDTATQTTLAVTLAIMTCTNRKRVKSIIHTTAGFLSKLQKSHICSLRDC